MGTSLAWSSVQVPLCHSLALSKVDVQLRLVPETHVVAITARAQTVGQTGARLLQTLSVTRAISLRCKASYRLLFRSSLGRAFSSQVWSVALSPCRGSEHMLEQPIQSMLLPINTTEPRPCVLTEQSPRCLTQQIALLIFSLRHGVCGS